MKDQEYDNDFDDVEDNDGEWNNDGIDEATADEDLTGNSGSSGTGSNSDDADVFTAKAGSASTSTGHETPGGGSYTKVRNVSIDRSGAFAISINAPKGSPRKVVTEVLENEEGVTCKAMKLFLGDGSDIDEDRGFYKKSQIYLTKPMQSAFNQALQGIGCPTSVGQFIDAYGDCKGGTAKESLPCDLIDAIGGAFYQGLDTATFMGKSVNIRRISENQLINWKVDKNVPIHKYFKESAVDPSKHWKLPNSYFYMHVARFQPVPSDIKVPDLEAGIAGRTIKFTDYAAKSFTIFEKATAAAFAVANNFDVLEVLHGEKRSDFDKWLQKLVINITLISFPSNYGGTHTHPRFWTPIKEDKVTKDKVVKYKGTGISLWEAMGTREFAIAMRDNRNAKPYSDEEQTTAWKDCCGDKFITTGKSGKTVVVTDKKNIRKLR